MSIQQEPSLKSSLIKDYPIWVTGMGAVSAAGLSAEALWDAACEGRRQRSWQIFDENHQYLTAQVPDITDVISEDRSLRKLDRTGQLSGLAVEEAMTQAGLERENSRAGVILGTSRGTLSKYMEAVNSMNRKKMRPLLAATGTMASISGSIVNRWGLQGPAMTVSSACASAVHAIASAAETILLGDADIMIAGGVDACLHPSVLGVLSAADVFGSDEDDQLVCRPFDKDRNGMLLGEGAGCLILESARSAMQRGAKPLAILRGWSLGSDGDARTGVDEQGDVILRTMQNSAQVASISAADIGYINAHGTGTPMNDIAEANAIESFQVDGQPIAVSSTKPITGHCLGATPALEAILTIKSLNEGLLPATMGCLAQDPKCKIDVIMQEPRRSDAQFALSNSLGFWGHTGTLLFGCS